MESVSHPHTVSNVTAAGHWDCRSRGPHIPGSQGWLFLLGGRINSAAKFQLPSWCCKVWAGCSKGIQRSQSSLGLTGTSSVFPLAVDLIHPDQFYSCSGHESHCSV